jgi:hypothetical protein
MHACMLVRHLYLSVLQDARARASRRRCPESGARCRAGFRLHDCDCASSRDVRLRVVSIPPSLSTAPTATCHGRGKPDRSHRPTAEELSTAAGRRAEEDRQCSRQRARRRFRHHHFRHQPVVLVVRRSSALICIIHFDRIAALHVHRVAALPAATVSAAKDSFDRARGSTSRQGRDAHSG